MTSLHASAHDRGVVLTTAIATFNSAKILPRVLDALTRQTLPRSAHEILIVDGGSTDETREIADRFNCTWLPNPRTEPVYAKFLAFKEAKGRYLQVLDHDEVIEDPRSLEKKLALFDRFPNVHAVVGSGYKTPADYPPINAYINEFGDPFSQFVYRSSKDYRFFESWMKKQFPIEGESADGIVLRCPPSGSLPLIELCALGSIVDREFFMREFPKTAEDPSLIPHFFYFMVEKSPYLGITKDDPIIHYSAETMDRYLNKIRWRVKNNIYHRAHMGAAGFAGRDKFNSMFRRMKKFLFIPYTLLVVPVVLDALFMAITRRRAVYLQHIPLCFFTLGLILYHSAMKASGRNPELRSYDESKVIKTVR